MKLLENQTKSLITPDGTKQFILAQMKLEHLFEYKNGNDEQTKNLVEWELYNRYIPCVYGKNDAIKMKPIWSCCPEWLVKTDKGNVYRSCVTYEDPTSPNPESNLNTNNMNAQFDYESMESAKLIANKDAKTNTARRWEIYLSTLNNKKIQVNRIITGISAGGYPDNTIGRSEVKVTPVDKSKEAVKQVLKVSE